MTRSLCIADPALSGVNKVPVECAAPVITMRQEPLIARLSPKWETVSATTSEHNLDVRQIVPAQRHRIIFATLK